MPRTLNHTARRLLPTLLLTGAIAAAAGTSGLTQPDTSSEQARREGRVLYAEHCASCHGDAGRGDGPAAASLRRPPTDLTRYAEANGGVFPAEQMRTVVDGRGVGAHGSVEMPVWGSVFKTTAGSEAAARSRIDAILIYVRSLQQRRGDEPAVGRARS